MVLGTVHRFDRSSAVADPFSAANPLCGARLVLGGRAGRPSSGWPTSPTISIVKFRRRNEEEIFTIHSILPNAAINHR